MWLNVKKSDRLINVIAFSLMLLPVAIQLRHYTSPSAVNSWGITEWLISYEGGFVRRGLLGDFILYLSQVFGLPPSFIAVVFSILAWLVLLFILMGLTRNIIPRYILFSPLLMGMPIYSDFLIRKDVLQVLFLAIILIILKRGFGAIAALAINFLAAIAILNHEAFLFFGVPIIIFTTLVVHTEMGKWEIFRCLAKYSAVISVGLLVVAAKGDQAAAMTIRDGWNEFLSESFPDYCCLIEHPAAIDAIGWTTRRGISLSLSLLNDFVFGVVYVPLIWGLTWLVSMYMLGYLAMPTKLKRNFFIIAALQSCAVLPLFLLGWDFGRWFFYIFASSVVWVSIYQNESIYIFSSLKFATLDGAGQKSSFFFFLSTVLLAVPACCWSGTMYLFSTPAGENARILVPFLIRAIGG